MRYDNKGNSTYYSSSEHYTELLELVAHILIPCIIAFIYGVIRLLKFHLIDLQGFVIVIGTILSSIGTISYCLVVNEKEKSWRNAISTWLGFFPFLFGCYLVFYKGFWSFKYLINSFSFWGLITPIIWILLGYRVVSKLHIMTEIDRLISEGKIIIK